MGCAAVSNGRPKHLFDQVSILVPVFNNAETLQPLVKQVTQAVQGSVHNVEFIFVEDASRDISAEVLREMTGGQIRVIYNSQNIGQQASIHAGLAACTGQAVVVMDADLQDPPHAIPNLLHALQSGEYDASFATRVGTYQSGWRMLTSRLFRFLVRGLTNLPQGAGGFVAFTADVARVLADKNNSRFYLAGMIGCGGYRIHAVPVERNLRIDGQSAYTGPMRLSLGLMNLMVVLKERFSHAQK